MDAAAADTALPDLQFLIANDAELQGGLDRVCDLLLDDDDDDDDDDDGDVDEACSLILSAQSLERMDVPSFVPSAVACDRPPETAKRRQATKPPRSTFEMRQKEELQRLRAEVEALKRQLQAKRAAGITTENMSFWERAAKRERVEMIKATHEQEQLNEALQQQATFVDQMQRVFHKKPRIEVHPDGDAWQVYKLAAQASLRATAIHAIADRQHRRMASAFLRAGLLDVDKDKFEAKLIPQPNGQSMMFQLVNHVTLGAPFQVLGESLWHSIVRAKMPYLPNDGAEILEEIDRDTVYGRYTNTSGTHTSWHSNLIRKHYAHHDRHVFIARTVLHDELSGPQSPNAVVENKCVWVTLTRLTAETCRLTVLVQIDVGRHDLDVATSPDMLTLLRDLAVPDPHTETGLLPSFPRMMDVDPAVFPFSNLRVFIEGGKRMQAVMNDAINSIVLAYKASPSTTRMLC